MNFYAEMGGSGNIIVADDGLRSGALPAAVVRERIAKYRDLHCLWCARPAVGRLGRFKKAGNLNYAIAVCDMLGDSIDVQMDRADLDILAKDVGFPVYENEGIRDLRVRFELGEVLFLTDADAHVPRDGFVNCAAALARHPSWSVEMRVSPQDVDFVCMQLEDTFDGVFVQGNLRFRPWQTGLKLTPGFRVVEVCFDSETIRPESVAEVSFGVVLPAHVVFLAG